MNAIERLEELLDEKDSEIDRLHDEIEALESDRTWKWTLHSSIEDDPLPVPRLELRWSNIEDHEKICTYSLVYKHLLGESITVPLGQTKVSGRMLSFENIEAWKPFRDGAHFYNEMEQLNLPGFVVIGDKIVHEIKPRKAQT